MRRATLSMFAQIVQLLPQSLFFRLVQKYQTDKASKGISTKDQLIAMMFCQLSLKIKTFVGTTLNAVMVQIWTALVVTLLLEVLKRRSKYPWSFSRLRSYIRLNLMTYKDLNDWLDEPDIVPIKTQESPPQACLF